MTWPNNIAGRPSGIVVYRLSKTRKSIVPMTISGVAKGINIKRLDARAVRPRQRARPRASATPSGVAMSMVKKASQRLLTSASRSDGSCQSERSGSSNHQRNEKPCQVLRDRPELKANWMAISTGTSDQMT